MVLPAASVIKAAGSKNFTWEQALGFVAALPALLYADLHTEALPSGQGTHWTNQVLGLKLVLTKGCVQQICDWATAIKLLQDALFPSDHRMTPARVIHAEQALFTLVATIAKLRSELHAAGVPLPQTKRHTDHLAWSQAPALEGQLAEDTHLSTSDADADDDAVETSWQAAAIEEEEYLQHALPLRFAEAHALFEEEDDAVGMSAAIANSDSEQEGSVTHEQEEDTFTAEQEYNATAAEQTPERVQHYVRQLSNALNLDRATVHDLGKVIRQTVMHGCCRITNQQSPEEAHKRPKQFQLCVPPSILKDLVKVQCRLLQLEWWTAFFRLISAPASDLNVWLALLDHKPASVNQRRFVPLLRDTVPAVDLTARARLRLAAGATPGAAISPEAVQQLLYTPTPARVIAEALIEQIKTRGLQHVAQAHFGGAWSSPHTLADQLR